MTPLDILRRYYGYTEFRPMQAEIIRHVTAGHDALVLMPTGGGKSVCYQIPALLRPGTAIVVSPLISLMKDQVEALRANGISAEAMNSANDEGLNAHIRTACEQGEVKLLYISPERLLSELTWLQHCVQVSMIAIDEAHCISQWGHDFRPEYTQLGGLHATFPNVPIVALTATADKLTRQDIVDQLRLLQPRLFVGSFDRPNLSLTVSKMGQKTDKLRVIRQLIARHGDDSGIIYCLAKKTCESVAEELRRMGFRADSYHAGLSAAERTRVQDDFLNDRLQVVCATIAFGMGIDKSNVRFVIHYNLPKSIENYYQEIGRAGRDGLPAETLLFYSFADVITLRNFAYDSGQQTLNLEKLSRMQEYAESQVCRRRILLNYFGQATDQPCHNCDVCHHPPQQFDGTLLIQKALSAMARTQQQVGIRMLISILRGAFSPEITEKGYHTLPTFGVGRDVPHRDWNDYLLQMLQMGYIEIAYDEHNHLRITPLGEDVLYGRRKAALVVPQKEEAAAPRKRTSKAQKEEAKAPYTPTTTDELLLKTLKQLRLDIAQEKRVPAFVIMSDRTLQDMVERKPTTRSAFAEVYGIGEHKCELYYEIFTTAITSFLQNQH
ncbi:MAG: DNA helicase RecQ [Bacteroidaceae bacterium]|nr:DNA helicase RecQ [Bacteroidaceae bacterium]